VRELTFDVWIDQKIIEMQERLIRLLMRKYEALRKEMRGLKARDSVKNAKTTSSITSRRSPQARGRTSGGIAPKRVQVELEAGRKDSKGR